MEAPVSIDVVNDQERLANLSFEQLRELVGLVEYDATSDPFPITGWDGLVWIVGNATQAALFYQVVYSMELVAYAGPETGVSTKCERTCSCRHLQDRASPEVGSLMPQLASAR